MMRKPKILVVGSFVMDLITTTDRVPGSGETIFGTSFTTAPGGKGANQAIQAARLGASATMMGKVGADDFGGALLRSCEAAGVDVSHVAVSSDVSSAVGNITLTPEGAGFQNRIIVVPGANMTLTTDDVAFLKDEISAFDMVILQLEINTEINELVAAWAHIAGVPVMLNSAPYAPVSPEMLSKLTYISPNEHEARGLTGISISTRDDARRAAEAIRAMGVRNVIITLGAEGAVLLTEGGQFLHSPCVSGIKAVDPTAAGDSFVAAFCTAICAGMPEREALSLANHTAAITVSRMGAQPSLPVLGEVVGLMGETGAACRSHPAIAVLGGK